MAEMSNPVDVMGRELPYSQEAELAVIGSALTNSHSVAESVEILRPSDFYFPQNKEIFSVILDLFNENAAIDFITVSNKLSQSDKLEAVGGIAYLRNAATNVPTTRHVTYYSQIIKEKAVLRTHFIFFFIAMFEIVYALIQMHRYRSYAPLKVRKTVGKKKIRGSDLFTIVLCTLIAILAIYKFGFY